MKQKDSQWIFIKIVSSNTFLYDVSDERAKSYIKLPFPSQSILNIQNNDNSCFLYSILAYFYYSMRYELDTTHWATGAIMLSYDTK